MIGLFKRQKIREDELAADFVGAFLPTVQVGFAEIAALINESVEFVRSPEVDAEDWDRFLLIALAANTLSIQQNFSSKYDQSIIREILERIAQSGSVSYGSLANTVNQTEKFISKVNHPSKNLIYGMSKAIFYKYELAGFQQEYFRNLNSPNPVFLKRLDEAVELFLWNWEDHSDR
ncbi:MAG: hypothetical protein RIC15_10465 [Vicingaceae bacterium]